MNRVRLVTETDGVEDVRGRVIAPSEIPDELDYEAMIHTATGWDVRRYGATIRAQKGTTVRWIWPRTRSAMEDTL